MPRVVPSQVVQFIATIRSEPGAGVNMNNVGSDRLSAVLDLVSQIPSELLTMR